MKILAVDTSTSAASIALAVNGRIVAENLFCSDRLLSARLVPEIMRLLESAGLLMSDIDLFASSIGPGSFTGVRGGVATIQGLALATEKPCVGFSSLAVLAMNFLYSDILVCPVVDARKNEVFGALYDCRSIVPSALIPDSVMSLFKLIEMILNKTSGQVVFTGDGSQKYQESLIAAFGSSARFAPISHQQHSASKGILLALDSYDNGTSFDPSSLLPLYLRASDAEINIAKR